MSARADVLSELDVAEHGRVSEGAGVAKGPVGVSTSLVDDIAAHRDRLVELSTMTDKMNDFLVRIRKKAKATDSALRQIESNLEIVREEI